MNALERFHRDDRAQVSFLAVAACICFVALLAMVINTNDMIEDRVHMQDTVDATALSAASWSARGLNLISFINVLNTKLLSTAVLLNSLNDALPIIINIAKIQEAIFNGCSGVPIIGAFCLVMARIVTFQKVFLQGLYDNVVKPATDQLSTCKGKGGALWTFMRALEKVGEGIRDTFVVIAMAESVSIAEANGATFGVVTNGKLLSKKPQDGLKLPVETGKFAEFCPKMKEGGSGYKLQGYECGEGPLTVGKDNIKTALLPFINLGAGPIFGAMVTKNMTQLGCKPGPGDNEKIKVQLDSLDECRTYKGTAMWTQMRSITEPVEDGTWTYRDFVPWKPKSEGTGKDTGEAEDLLGDLERLDPNAPEAPDAAPQNMSEGWEAIDKDTEGSVGNVKLFCPNEIYPQMLAEKVIMQFCPAGGCTRVDRIKDFHYVSAQQQIGVQDGKTGGYFIRVGEPEELPPEKEGGPKRYVYTVETVVLSSAGEKEMTLDEYEKYLKDKGTKLDSENNTTGCEKKAPKPWMLDKGPGYEDRLRFIGFVYKDIDKELPFWSRFFADPPTRIYAYAQARVYNYLSEDTFTQDWRVRLEPASLLETFLEKTDTKGLKKDNAFSNFIGTVNNH